MASFLTSPDHPPPHPGFVSVCDTGRSLGNVDNLQSLCEDITIINDVTKQDNGSKPAFLPHSETKWKKAFCSWRDNGLYQALEVLASDEIGYLSTRVAQLFLNTYHSLNSIAGRFYPHYQFSVSELSKKYSITNDWKNVVIKFVSWHPERDWMAVVRQDDSIEVKGGLIDSHQREDQSCVLKDSRQIGVTCVQWRPHCYTAMLAVGMETGLSLWNADPNVMQSRLASSLLRYDRYPGHVPITSLSFSPDGLFLVSACPVNSTMLVWDVTLGVATPLQRIGGGGVSLVSWSPDSLRVFAATPTPMFRIWECNKWSCEKWSNLSGRCIAASWSPVGDYLLFAVEGDSCIYYIHCDKSQLVSSSFTSSAVKCADLSIPMFETGPDNVLVGGWVQSMAWDSNGRRLAVIFTKDSPACDIVAILHTNLQSRMEIIPGGFIRGLAGETPVCVDFKVINEGQSVLATAWSSGRISFSTMNYGASLTMPHSLPTQLDKTHLYSLPAE